MLRIFIADKSSDAYLLAERLTSLGYVIVGTVSPTGDWASLIKKSKPDVLLLSENSFDSALSELSMPLLIIARSREDIIHRLHKPENNITLIHSSYTEIELAYALENVLLKTKQTAQLQKTEELQKKLEMKEIESNIQFKFFMDFLPAAIFIKDDKSKVVYINKFFHDHFNADESWIGKDTLDIFPVDIAKKMIEDDNRALREGYYILEEKIPDKKGIVRDFQTHKFIIKISDSKLLIGGVGLDITEEKKKLKALRESEERYRALFEGAGEGILIADIETKNFLYANPAISKMLGYSVDELTSMNVRNIHPQENLDYVLGEFELQAKGEKLMTTEIPCLKKNKSIIYADILTTKLMINNKDCNVGFFTDISERKLTQDRIRDFLKEKETLLKEIHHRVKNNLQIITSLLDLQLNSLDDEKTKNIFINSMNRIYSMSLVHEMLYQSENMSLIDFSNYISSLIKTLQQTLTNNHQNIIFTLDIQRLNLPMNKAIPCGLIVNELISNALKHAFIDCAHGEIKISFFIDQDNQNKLIIHDNGRGLPDDFDITKTKSLGLLLVRELTSQLKGALSIANNNGAYFAISFK